MSEIEKVLRALMGGYSTISAQLKEAADRCGPAEEEMWQNAAARSNAMRDQACALNEAIARLEPNENETPGTAGRVEPDSPRRRCLCDQCTRIMPMERSIREALPEDLGKMFDYLCLRRMVVEEDLACAEAKLKGEWPGWGWLAEARKQREMEAEHVRH